MNTLFKIIAFIFDIFVKTFCLTCNLLYKIMKAIFKKMKPELDRIDAKGAGLLAMSFAVIALVVCMFSGWESTDTFLNAKADDSLTFNLEPPEEYDWTLLGKVLNGNYNSYQQRWMSYAWNKYKDREFMYMMASENGLFNHDRRSLVPGEPSYGFCQIHKGYHPEIVNDPRFFTDPAWQLDQCYKLFKGGTVFYGYVRFKQSEREGSEFARARKALFQFNS